MDFRFDHLAVAGHDLPAAVAYVEDALGLPMGGGGKHPHFGTHNKLLGLGPFYLEAISIDPDAAPLGSLRWFGLDDFVGTPRITNWICQTDDMAGMAQIPLDFGEPVALQRGDLRWTMLVPKTGHLPSDGACPAVIDWGQTPHPAPRLQDVGAQLLRLTIAHPDGVELAKLFAPHLDCDVIRFEFADRLSFEAVIETPHGQRILT